MIAMTFKKRLESSQRKHRLLWTLFLLLAAPVAVLAGLFISLSVVAFLCSLLV